MQSQRHILRAMHRPTIGPYLWSIGLIGLTTAVFWFLYHHFDETNVAMFYLVAVVFCAATAGRAPAVASAVASFLAFKFFFVEPTYTFTIDDARDVWQLGSFVAAALIVGAITLRARQQTALAQQQKQDLEALYSLSQALSVELDEAPIAMLIVHAATRLLNTPGCTLVLDSSSATPGHATSYGSCIEITPFVDTPLPGRSHTLGVLRVALPAPQTALTPIQQRMCHLIAAQAALSIERSYLAQAASQAQVLAESDRLKSTLLSAVSHDVRTPLAGIIAATDELLAEDVHWTQAAMHNFASIIKREATQLHTLVSNMLDLTRIEAHALRPQRGWYNVTEIMHRALHRLAGELATHPVDVQLPETMPLMPVDYVYLEQVFWNVLLNAARYSPPTAPIAIAAQWDDTTLCVTITDHGPGIPADARMRVFEKFYRLPHATETSVPGAGLGLAICKGLVEAHGGTMSMHESPAGGTQVRIELPL